MTPLTLISSDGHATALMRDYRPYLEAEFREDFDAFLDEWEDRGSRSFDLRALRHRLDPELVDQWEEVMVATGRLEGNWNPTARLEEMEREGVCAEVVFPDFGLPFELYSPLMSTVLKHPPAPTPQMEAGFRAYNSWLADFCSETPERFAGMGLASWREPDEAVAEIRRCKKLGLTGVVLPKFSREAPLYDSRFDVVWQTLVDLDMVVNLHIAISSTADMPMFVGDPPHPGCVSRVMAPELFFYAQNILTHLIWGGVLEKFPRLKIVVTELGSGWIAGALQDMDYTYQGSYARSDIRSFLKLRPSEYFARQCYIGASTFSKAEIDMRELLGVDKIMFGMDYPHHEGTMIEGTRNYLRATYGAVGVPESEARAMLGLTAAEVFGFDLAKLAPVVERIDLRVAEVLTPPETDLYPRGDVHKPAPVFIRPGGDNPGRALSVR
ncbi:amidohydrolase family protein [Nocardioides humi]|uniref:Amidohydrolase family protein n=1 Tax=Nocardioides humi TaxID=449461 RepID=A0ABN2AEA5_9ACTN|nr:amidohydrolase family protein [Nocardioides humi]